MIEDPNELVMIRINSGVKDDNTGEVYKTGQRLYVPAWNAYEVVAMGFASRITIKDIIISAKTDDGQKFKSSLRGLGDVTKWEKVANNHPKKSRSILKKIQEYKSLNLPGSRPQYRSLSLNPNLYNQKDTLRTECGKALYPFIVVSNVDSATEART